MAGHAHPFRVERPGGAELHAESIGDRHDPALLLLSGATWSLDWWDDELCDLLAAQRLRVLRFDARDTGQSTSYPAGQPGYDAADLVEDAVAILDVAGVERAHVAGLSMGGGLAQRLALAHPDRVSSLTLISTSPIDPRIEGLPDPSSELFGEDSPAPDWSDRAAVVDRIVEGDRPFAGPGNFDEERMRELAGRVFDRTPDIEASQTNHFLIATPEVEADLSELAGLPALVVHGDADPLFPLEHGRALADAIPGAELLVLEDVGHQLPPPHTWPRLAEAIGELAGASSVG